VELRGAGGAELENEADGVGTGDLDSRRRECHGKSCPGGAGRGGGEWSEGGWSVVHGMRAYIGVASDARDAAGCRA